MEYEVNIGFLKDANFNSFFMADSSGEWRRRGLDIVQKVPQFRDLHTQLVNRYKECDT